MSQPSSAGSVPAGANSQPVADLSEKFPVYNTFSNIVEERLDLDQAQVALGLTLIAIIFINCFFIWIAWNHYSDKISRIYAESTKEKERESSKPKDE
uniref:Uncharacterized protein n=1 Tax=Plectus sambesii TaxID=2011161 RepID=A0A914VC21_9BILA